MKLASLKTVGPPHTHQEIKRLRREVGDMLRRYGQPVAYFTAWNLDDIPTGEAKRCPACFSDVYSQPRADCLVCFGTTLVSTENSTDHWIDANGALTTAVTDLVAPAYGGFREPILTRVMQPDAGTDVFRINEQGVLLKTQDATAVAYWTPTMGDNDMLVDVTLNTKRTKIVASDLRYLTKMVGPQTIRGWGSRAHDQRYVVGQTFEMNTLPKENIFWSVPIPVHAGEI